MGDMGDDFRAMREANRERRERNLGRAQDSKLPWTRHTEFHWSLELQGDRLDYWPSTDKFRWRGKTYTGGIEGFVRKRL